MKPFSIHPVADPLGPHEEPLGFGLVGTGSTIIPILFFGGIAWAVWKLGRYVITGESAPKYVPVRAAPPVRMGYPTL